MEKIGRRRRWWRYPLDDFREDAFDIQAGFRRDKLGRSLEWIEVKHGLHLADDSIGTGSGQVDLIDDWDTRQSLAES